MKVLLKKLKYFNYFYYIKLLVKDLPKDINLIDIKIINEKITGYTNKKNILLLNKLNIEFEILKYHHKIKNFLIRKWLGILSLIIIVLLMFSSNLFVRNISFKTNCTYDEEVLSYIKSNLKTFGKVYLLNGNLNELNNRLRTKFNYYEFINVYKVNGDLVINIVKNENKVLGNVVKESDIVSKKNAYVLKIQISSGIRNIELFQMVKKGDILISGNKPVGYIIGRCIESVDYQIPKSYKRLVYTSNYYTNRYIKISETKKEENLQYEKYYKKTNIIYQIGNFSLVEDVYFEQKEILIEYTKEDVEHYLYDYIKYLFYSNHHYDEERIIDIKIVNIKEDDRYFYLKTINTTIEQLGEYKE